MKQKKQIRFSLIMKDGNRANTLEELRQFFSVAEIHNYFFDGRLEMWLRQRNFIELADSIAAIPKEAGDYLEQICKVLGIALDGKIKIDIDNQKKPLKDVREEFVGTLKLILDQRQQIEDTEENMIFRDDKDHNIWLEGDHELTKVQQVATLSGIARIGDCIYIKKKITKKQPKHLFLENEYGIVCYDVKTGLETIIINPANGYTIIGGSQNNIIYYKYNDEQLLRQRTLYEVRLDTGNTVTHRISLPCDLDEFRFKGDQESCSVDESGSHVYTYSYGKYNREYYLLEICLDDDSSRIICPLGDWDCFDGTSFYMSFHREGVCFWNNHDQCFFYDVRKDDVFEVEPLSAKVEELKKELMEKRPESIFIGFGGYIHMEERCCYYNGKIYAAYIILTKRSYISYTTTNRSGEMMVFEYDLAENQLCELASLKFDDLPSYGMKIANNMMYLGQLPYDLDMYEMRLYRVNMDTWKIDKLTKKGDQLLWEALD